MVSSAFSKRSVIVILSEKGDCTGNHFINFYNFFILLKTPNLCCQKNVKYPLQLVDSVISSHKYK